MTQPDLSPRKRKQSMTRCVCCGEPLAAHTFVNLLRCNHEMDARVRDALERKLAP